MVIYSNSRYSTAKITGLLINGQVKKYVHSRKIVNPDDVAGSTKMLTFEPSHELDSLAVAGGLNESLWWVLADVNEIVWPLYDATLSGNNYLTIGKTVLVPQVSVLTVPSFLESG